VSDLLGITVADLVALLRDRGKRVPFEVGAFITLKAVERVVERPAPLAPDAVRVTDDGMVSVYAAPGPGDADVTQSAQGLLAHLLVGAGAAVPQSMLDLVERGPSDGSGRLERFRDELEASLLPLNRGASQRILARLVRESRAGGDASSSRPQVDLADLDADLDALLGGGGGDAGSGSISRPISVRPSGADGFAVTSPRPVAMSSEIDALATTVPRPMRIPAEARPTPAPSPTPSASPDRTPIPSPISRPDPTPSVMPSPRPSPKLKPNPRPMALSAQGPAPEPTAIPEGGGRRQVTRRSVEEDDDYALAKPRGSSRGLLVGLAFVGLILGTAAMVYAVRPDVLARMMGDAPPAPDHSAEEAAHLAEAERRAAEAAGRYGDLRIHVPHDRAQILMRVGRGPAIATNLPVGIAHEFVAIADGRVPTRAVVPPDATWEPTEEGPRYELAMQAGEAEMPFESLELGDTRLPRDVGANRNQLGSVRVLTNPPGAEVFLLIGFAPDAQVRDLRADQTYEVVVWAEGFAPKRVIVRPEDFVAGEDGKKAASVEVGLTERRRGRR
jgi:hypothetical protein